MSGTDRKPTITWERDKNWSVVEKEAYVYRYEDGLLVGRYRGFFNFRSRSIRCYPDKVLCRGWRFPGVCTIHFEDVKGM